MWPATAAVSAGMALVLKLRGDHLSRQCDRTLEELEATEDDLDEVKMKVKSLMEQVKVQESTIMEVRRSKVKAEDEALRAARQAAEQERSAMTLKAQLDAVAKELDAKLKKEAKAAGKEIEPAAAAAESIPGKAAAPSASGSGDGKGTRNGAADGSFGVLGSRRSSMVESEGNFWSEKQVHHSAADGTSNPRLSFSGGWNPKAGDFNRPRSPPLEPADSEEMRAQRRHAGGQFNANVDDDASANVEMMEKRIAELTTAAQNARTEAELTAATAALDEVFRELTEAQKLMKVQAQLEELKRQMEKEEREASAAKAALARAPQVEAQLEELKRQLEKEEREARAAKAAYAEAQAAQTSGQNVQAQLEELERLQRELAAELAASQQQEQAAAAAGPPPTAAPARRSNPKLDSGARSPSTGAFRIRKLSMSMQPESSADLDDPPAEMYSLPGNGNGNVVMNQLGLGKQARRSIEEAGVRPSIDAARQSVRPSIDAAQQSVRPSIDRGGEGLGQATGGGAGRTRRASISEKKKGADVLTAMMNPVATHGTEGRRQSIDRGPQSVRPSIDRGSGGLGQATGGGGGRTRRASISEKKKGVDVLSAMMNPVATHGAGAKRVSIDGGARKQRRGSFAEAKCVMCKVEKPVTGDKLCRLCIE